MRWVAQVGCSMAPFPKAPSLNVVDGPNHPHSLYRGRWLSSGDSPSASPLPDLLGTGGMSVCSPGSAATAACTESNVCIGKPEQKTQASSILPCRWSSVNIPSFPPSLPRPSLLLPSSSPPPSLLLPSLLSLPSLPSAMAPFPQRGGWLHVLGRDRWLHHLWRPTLRCNPIGRYRIKQ